MSVTARRRDGSRDRDRDRDFAILSSTEFAFAPSNFVVVNVSISLSACSSLSICDLLAMELCANLVAKVPSSHHANYPIYSKDS